MPHNIVQRRRCARICYYNNKCDARDVQNWVMHLHAKMAGGVSLSALARRCAVATRQTNTNTHTHEYTRTACRHRFVLKILRAYNTPAPNVCLHTPHGVYVPVSGACVSMCGRMRSICCVSAGDSVLFHLCAAFMSAYKYEYYTRRRRRSGGTGR